MANPPQVVRRDPPPRAASASVAASLQQRQPSISAVVASVHHQQNTKVQRAVSGSSGKGARSPATRNRKDSILDDDDSDDLDGFDSSDEENPDLFFTPNQSPRTSMASSSILFPRQPRANSPRQASRKSLRVSNASLQVAPGIAASNSGSSSVKPIPNHVNRDGSSIGTPASSPGGANASTATTTQAHPMPLAVQQLQQGQTRQRRMSNNTVPPPISSVNGSAASKAPASAGSVVPKSPVQQQSTRRASGSASATLPPPESNSSTSTLTGRPAATPTSPDHQAADANATAPSRSTPSSSSSAPPPSRSAPTRSSKPTSAVTHPQESPLSTKPVKTTAPRSSTAPGDNTSGVTRNSSSAAATSTSSPSSHAQGQQQRTSAQPVAASSKMKPLPKSPVPPTLSNQSSSNSLSSTTLENHSDVFSTTGSEYNQSYSTALSTPGNSAPGSSLTSKGPTSLKKTPPSPLSNGSTPQPPPMRSNSLRSTRTPAAPPPVSRPARPATATNTSSDAMSALQQAALQKRYSYTAEDWEREMQKVPAPALDELVHWNNDLEKKMVRDLATNQGVVVAGSSSKKKDDQRRSLGRGAPVHGVAANPEDLRDSSSAGSSPRSSEHTKDVKDKGKSKEKSEGLAAKLKRKKTGTGPVEREVSISYWKAKHGTPVMLPLDLHHATNENGAGVDGVGSSSTRTFSAPAPVHAPAVPKRGNGYGVHQPSLTMTMRSLMEESESSDGRLSVVTERDEPETPTAHNPPTLLGGPLTKEPHTSTVFNAFAPLRSTNNVAAAPVEMIRRRSRSVGEHEAEEQSGGGSSGNTAKQQARQSSVNAWANEYQDILARTKGKANASGSSLTSPSQHSFAYRNAMPVPSGDLPSNGTPGYTHLHLARAPPGTYVKDGDVHSRLPGSMSGPTSPNGQVDLTRDGSARATIASVEVIRGLGSVKRGLSGVFSSLGRRRTVSGGEGMDLLQNRRPRRLRKGSEGADPRGVLTGGTGSDKVLGFTTYRPPPNYVPASCVLVQVWAVGVDATDAKLVGLRLGKKRAGTEDEPEEDSHMPTWPAEEGDRPAKRLGRSLSLRERLGSLSRRKNSLGGKDATGKEAHEGANLRRGRSKSRARDKDSGAPPIAQPEVGFIPGRSFVGRVMDTGWQVTDDRVKRGDWVIGLLDPRKVRAQLLRHNSLLHSDGVYIYSVVL